MTKESTDKIIVRTYRLAGDSSETDFIIDGIHESGEISLHEYECDPLKTPTTLPKRVNFRDLESFMNGVVFYEHTILKNYHRLS